MIVVDFFAASNVLIVAGKGGVGKTTVGASIGLAAARAGLDTLIIELEGRSKLAAPFGIEALDYEEITLVEAPEVPGRLRARQITPDDALVDYLTDTGLGRLAGRFSRTGTVDLITTSAPGIRDLVTIGKIRNLEQSGAADLIIVDAPAAGHAITFLRSPAGLAGSATGGPIRAQAEAALEMLADPSRCQVLLVTLPEETPVTELVETAFTLEDHVDVKLGPVIVNAVWPEIDGLAAAGEAGDESAIGYRLARLERQQAEIERLKGELPVAQLQLPFIFSGELTKTDIGLLADALETAVLALEVDA